MPVSTVSRRIAELEEQLGVRLIERSTRNLRLTGAGAELFELAQRGAELSDAVDNIVSNQRTEVSGRLHLSAPPSVSDTLLAPLISAFQLSYPQVRVQVLVTDRWVDHIAEGVDLVFRLGELKDSTLVARKVLTYRHQLVASPAYLASHAAPETPQDLLKHRLLAFSHWRPDNGWTFVPTGGGGPETLRFVPHLAMNDYIGLASALVAGAGIGDLPPVVQPELIRDGKLVEVMPHWRFRAFDLSIVHVGRRHVSRPVKMFKEFAERMTPTLFQGLPT
jgi:DNA-binding transcriptional LysR family regulator